MVDETKEDVVSSKENVEEINEDNSKEKTISGELRDMKDYSLLAFLSYFLLIINTIAFPFINRFESNWHNFFFIVLSLATLFSFSIYIYLRSNDERFESSFLSGANYSIALLQIILLLFLVPFSLMILWELPYLLSSCLSLELYWCSPVIMFCSYWISFWLVFFSLTYNPKFVEITDDNFKSESVDNASKTILVDTPKTGFGLSIMEIIFGFSGFLAILIGFVYVQLDYSAWWGNRTGTFAHAIPCYAISFILLIFMFAMRLDAKNSSQDSALKELIKADNWKKFKTRVIGLVVVFSLLMPLLWYENHTYWENKEGKYITLNQDCNDAVIGPDLNLVNADLSGLYLYGCDLSNRNLTGADFVNTQLRCVDFSNSILVGANFGPNFESYYDEKAPNIELVTFDNADLSNATFSGNGYNSIRYYGEYYLTPDIDCPDNLSFKGANLTNAYFNTLFREREYGGSKLIFDNAIMDNATLMVRYSDYDDSVSMVNVSFIGTDISMTMPPGTDLSQSNMSEANFIDFMALDLASCPLSLPETYNCAEISGKKMIFGPSMDFSYKYIYYTDADSLGITGPGVNFSGLYLPHSTFHGVLLSGSDMSNANLSNSNFTYSHKIYDEQYLDYSYWLEDADEENRTYIEASLEEWGVDNFSGFKSLWSANLTNVDFTGSNLSYSDFSYSNMAGAKLENTNLTGAIWYYTICPDGTNSGKTGSCIS